MYEYHNLVMLKAENPSAYKKLAEEGIMVAHPVSIKGQPNRPDIGLGYHSTVKLFDPAKDSATSIHDTARSLKLTPPDPHKTHIEPSMFKDRFGNDVYVLKLHGEHADNMKANNSKFSHMGFPASYEFTPHISVDKATWDHVVDSGAQTAHEAGITFGPAQLKQGHKVITTYKHGNVVQLPVAPEKKLAASEKMENDLKKSPVVSDEYSNVNFPAGPITDPKIKTIKSKEGHLIHVFYNPDESKHTYAITHNGKHTGNPISIAEVLDHDPDSGEEISHLAFAHTWPGHEGKGMSSALHRVAIKQHGELGSDRRLSPGSQAIWNKMGSNKNIKVNMASTTPGSIQAIEDRHVATYSKFLPKSEQCDGEQLQKSIKSTVAAAAMASMIGLASATPTNPSTEVPQQSYQSKYDSGKMLRTIAQVESSGGKFANHRMLGGMHNGDSAYGKYGLTPVVIRETVGMHPELKSKYGKVQSLGGQDLKHFMQDSPGLEDKVAQQHLARLEHHFGHDPAKLGFAWLEGISGTYKAEKENKDIKGHWHAKKITDAYAKDKE